ncbi:MAG: thioredoxin domain-containing protein [Patescibacteria group bacterium]
MQENHEQHKHHEQEVGKVKKDYLLPASILISAVLISVSLVYNVGKKPSDQVAPSAPTDSEVASLIKNVKPFSNKDHYFGDPKAPLKIIEFSDLECPFCRNFHPVLEKIVNESGGKVVWAYRHFPLDAIHLSARKAAEASECAADQGGNNAFWSYIGKIFEPTATSAIIAPAMLPKLAVQIGLDQAKFESCLSSGKFADLVESQSKDAQNSGGKGTPHSIIISPKGKYYVVPGALPYDRVKAMVEEALKN